MALPRVHIVLGWKADRTPVALHTGTSPKDATEVYLAEPAAGIVAVQLFKFPEASRVRQIQKKKSRRAAKAASVENTPSGDPSTPAPEGVATEESGATPEGEGGGEDGAPSLI